MHNPWRPKKKRTDLTAEIFAPYYTSFSGRSGSRRLFWFGASPHLNNLLKPASQPIKAKINGNSNIPCLLSSPDSPSHHEYVFGLQVFHAKLGLFFNHAVIDLRQTDGSTSQCQHHASCFSVPMVVVLRSIGSSTCDFTFTFTSPLTLGTIFFPFQWRPLLVFVCLFVCLDLDRKDFPSNSNLEYFLWMASTPSHRIISDWTKLIHQIPLVNLCSKIDLHHIIIYWRTVRICMVCNDIIPTTTCRKYNAPWNDSTFSSQFLNTLNVIQGMNLPATTHRWVHLITGTLLPLKVIWFAWKINVVMDEKSSHAWKCMERGCICSDLMSCILWRFLFWKTAAYFVFVDVVVGSGYVSFIHNEAEY